MNSKHMDVMPSKDGISSPDVYAKSAVNKSPAALGIVIVPAGKIAA